MYDLHNHILPGIDDGAQDLATSLEMIQLAHDHGTKVMVATPHVVEGKWLPKWETILKLREMVQQEADQQGIPMKIHAGAEVFISLDNLQLLEQPGTYCMNGGKYILAELPCREIPSYTEEFFFTLQARGMIPIVAHAERHPELAKNPDLLLDWVQKGILVQVNGSSLLGKMGERVMQTAELLIKNELVHIMGSDGHGLRSRRPMLDGAYNKVLALAGEEYCQQIFRINPADVLASRDVSIPEVTEFSMRTGKRGILNWVRNLF